MLTDGRVMVQDVSTENWFQLVPDELGSYENGTWSFLSRMPSGYSPLYTAVGVLADGKVIVEGGEYLNGDPTWTNRGALYDPVANTWQEIAPPPGWASIGDASGLVLPDNQFLLSNCCTDELALFDERTTSWTAVGTGKRDINDEESWVQLWDGTILTVDANNLTNLKQAELYDPATGAWTSAGETPVPIADTNANNSGTHEVGPEILMPNGEILALGGNGHNVIYSTVTKTWRQIDDMPSVSGGVLDSADGPGVILPNGTALFSVSPGFANPDTHFFEWDGTAFAEVDKTPNSPANSSFNNFMMMLPTGEVLLTDFSTDVELYTPTPGITPIAVPVITSAPHLVGESSAVVPLAATPVVTLLAGRTYFFEADRINGISQGAYYGDDLSPYTNFPLVRITNDDTRHVRYCKTHDFAHRKIGPDTHGSAQFDLPADLELGPSTMETVANGIASPPVEINVR